MHRPADLSDDEFEQIEERLSETPKGRAFLRRYARRSAAMGVDEVRTIVADLRDMISGRGEGVGPAGHMDVLRRELMEMAASIERARRARRGQQRHTGPGASRNASGHRPLAPCRAQGHPIATLCACAGAAGAVRR